MEIRAEINNRLKEALKSKDQVGLSTVRLIMAALKDRDITARGTGRSDGIDDAEILSMLQSMMKQRHESIETYENANRLDLAEREKAEIRVIESFMPKQLSDAEIEAAVAEKVKATGAAGIRDMGAVMAALKAEYAGQFDMGKASALVKAALS